MSKTIVLNAGSGDCHAGVPVSGVFSRTGTELFMSGNNTVNDVFTWIPFLSFPLNQGKIITSATLKVTATQNSGTGTTPVTIGCEDADNPAGPTTLADLRARVMTSAHLSATIVQYTTGTVYSYNITTAVQEVLNRSGFAMGNTLAVYIQDTLSDNTPHLIASSENPTYTPAQLEIVVPYFLPTYNGVML